MNIYQFDKCGEKRQCPSCLGTDVYMIDLMSTGKGCNTLACRDCGIPLFCGTYNVVYTVNSLNQIYFPCPICGDDRGMQTNHMVCRYR